MAKKMEHNFFKKLTDHFVNKEYMEDNQKIVSELQSGTDLSNSQLSKENYNTGKMRAMSVHFEKDVEVVPHKIRARSASCSHKTKIFVTDQVNIASECNSSSNNIPVESIKPDKKKKKRKGPIELEDFQNDSFFQTLKALQLETKKPSGLEKAKEKLITLMAEGSEFLRKQQPRLAAEKYKTAIDMIIEANAELYDLKEIDFVTLQYALGHCYIEAANYPDICKGIEIFLEIKKVHFSEFPTIYHALGSAYYKLNRFRVATQHLKTGLEFLEKKILFESQPWPGTNIIIKLTTMDGLKEELINLLHLSDAYYLPDATCRYTECLSIYPHIIPSRNIFYSDPDFVGFIVVYCEENCKIEYHPHCWKNYKESLNFIEKICDKKILGKECPTNDCVTCYNKKSSIIKIEIYGEDGNLKSECVKDMANDQSSTNKKSKKKREKLNSISIPEKVKKKAKRVRRMSESLQNEDRKEQNTAQGPVNDLSCRLQRLACLRKRNFDCNLEQSWDPSKINCGQSNIDNLEKFPTTIYDSMETKATKDFIFSYFSDVLIENGPMEKQFVTKKWLKDFEDSPHLREFLSFYNNDIIKFLLTSRQFALIEDTLCHSKDVPDAYNVTKTVLTESLSFVLNDNPIETLHSHNDNATIPNTELTDTIQVEDKIIKSQLETITSPQIEEIYESKPEEIGMQPMLSQIENANVQKEDSYDYIQNCNQSLQDENNDCETKINHPETRGTDIDNFLQQTELKLNGFFVSSLKLTDVSGDNLSSNNVTDIKPYLTSDEPIFKMETFDNSVHVSTNNVSEDTIKKVIEIFLAEMELILKNKFDTIDQVTMDQLKNLMYNYAKMNCMSIPPTNGLCAFDEQIEVADIDKTNLAVILEEVKLNVVRTDEEVERIKKTLTEKLCIQNLKLKKLISLIDKLKEKMDAAENFYEVSSKEKFSFYKKKCETNIMYSKLLLQSETAILEAGIENIMKKLEVSEDLRNVIVHLERNNNVTSQSNGSNGGDFAESITTTVFRQIDEISDYLNVGIQKLLSITVKNYSNHRYGDAKEDRENYDFYSQNEQFYNIPTNETSRNNTSDVSCYPNLLYNNISEYYNLHRNLATLPLQQKTYYSPTEVINKNVPYIYPINKESVVENPLDQNVFPQTNTLSGENLNLMSSGIHSGINSEAPYMRSDLTANEMDHVFPKLCTKDFFFQPRTIWQEEKPQRYKQLVDRLLFKYVTWERHEMEALLMSIRERKNGLSGLKLFEIFNLVEQEVQERNKIWKGTMGIEKFGDTAWRGIKTNKVWSKPTDATQDDCVICMDPMTDDSTSLQCMHSFHTKCIKDWLSTKTVCPICQALALLHEEFPPLDNVKSKPSSFCQV